MIEFQVNEYLSLRNKGYKTEIFVKDEKFIQCKSLILNIINDSRYILK